MRQATIDGRKTMTTRTYRISPGLHTAETDKIPFAVIKVLDSIATKWDQVTGWHFREEGFESPEEMRAWAVANNLGHYATSPKQLYRHPYEVVRLIEAAPQADTAQGALTTT